MGSNPNSVSKTQGGALKISPEQAMLWARLSTYGHVVGIDVVISWVCLDRKLDTGNIICGIERKKVLIRNIWGELHTREKSTKWQHRGSSHILKVWHMAFYGGDLLDPYSQPKWLAQRNQAIACRSPAELRTGRARIRPPGSLQRGSELFIAPDLLLRQHQPTAISILGVRATSQEIHWAIVFIPQNCPSGFCAHFTNEETEGLWD